MTVWTQGNGTAGRDSLLVRCLIDQGIRDPRVLAAFARVPRSFFVPDEARDEAEADRPLEIGCGQTISQPYVVAVMTAAIRPQKGMRVLEVGTGSGYQAAVLSRLAREVVTVERYRTLADTARSRLAALGYENVDVIVGDGFAGVPDRAPFDRIIVTAAAEEVPAALTKQLAEGGVMLLPLGPHGGTQYLVKLTKTAGKLARETLLAVRFVPLVPGQAREL